MSRDHRQSRPRGRRGLTLPELILGTAMLGIVMMAAAGLMTAVAAGWRNGEVLARTSGVAGQAGVRIEDALAPALYVLQAKAPAAGAAASYLFVWMSDGVTGAADGKAQLGEMAVVEYDPTAKSVRLIQAIPATQMTSAQLAAAQAGNWGDPTSPSVVEYFKQQSFVAPPVTLIGGQSGASEVASATFGWYSVSGAKPMVSYSLNMTQGGLPVSRQGAVALRSGQKPKNVN